MHTAQSSPEVGQAPEALTEAQFSGLLNGMANHEAKLLTAAIVTGNPEQWFSRQQLYRELLSAQGQTPAWKVNRSAGGEYCSRSLVPSGAVVVGEFEDNGRSIAGYHATEFGAQWGLAWAGGLADWSLRHSNVSLQRLLSASHSPTDNRGPELRLQIFSDLLTAPSNEVSLMDIIDSVGRNRTDEGGRLNRHIHNLDKMGVLELNSKYFDFNPIFEILSPDFYHIQRDISDMQPATQALYAAMGELFKGKGTEVSLETLVEVAANLAPEIPQYKLYQRAMPAASNVNHFPNLVITDRNGAPIARNVVSLKPEYRASITDLVETIEALRDPAKVADFAERGRALLGDSRACYALMEKGQRFSSRYLTTQNGGHDALGRLVVGIIRDSGPLTVSEVQEQLESQGRTLQRGTVGALLREVARQGSLEVSSVAVSPKTTRIIHRYSVTGS
ncbi:MAG: hypothetical protein JWM81_254 [Candidatus Saccharibacteria bacterium]|nr:hypothetical protein [Candidatus Saccharibacteria bacterium]